MSFFVCISTYIKQMNKQLIECVPNFSEGRDLSIIKQITDQIESVTGIRLLDVDPGQATNRTVVTFVGEPEAVIEAAFLGIQQAAKLIDMRQHKGEHPRAGATDVCPFIPISGITMEETAQYARQLAARVGKELNIPTYLYEAAAAEAKRKNLANIRAGEYEGLSKKLADPAWQPDFGPAEFTKHTARTGYCVIGARDFLIAYNVNLNTTSVKRANSVAYDVREKGRIKRVNGKTVRDENGKAIRQLGTLKHVKAIGWYIEEYQQAQVSINLTNIRETPLHLAFDEVCKSAFQRGLRVTGSELVGLVPLSAIVEAGKYFLRKQNRSAGVSEAELIRIAIKTMGLSELAPFDPKQKIIEYLLDSTDKHPLIHQTINDFADETASESPAPGGGSVAAYLGALGAALGTMVANLSANKRGWETQIPEFSIWAEQGQILKKKLLALVDEDTHAFNRIRSAVRLPKKSAAEKAKRQDALLAATKYAIEIPLQVMQYSVESMELMAAMAANGLPSSVSDAGVGAACARTAAVGAYLNVKINMAGLTDDVDYVKQQLALAQDLLEQAKGKEAAILDLVMKKIDSN